MCSHWTEAKLFKFLRLYKRYECLWNPYSPEYGSSDAKSKAFSQILSEINVFGLTVNECLNQIKHIRAIYKQEQQRLKNIAFLGGSSYSNLLWYPLMNSMLSKVIRDEKKLNPATGNRGSVMAPKCLPSNSGDQPNQRDLNQIGFGQRTFPWNPNETRMMCPLYFPNSNYEDYRNFYPDSNIFNNSVGMNTSNEHIGPCPTCGFSSDSSCDCFSMDNVGYRPDYIGQSYCSSQSEIHFRPRTSYNYRNGILEINSAVRIPVSQPSPNYGYSNLIESIIPEESEYNLNPILSNHQPDMQTVEQKEEYSLNCCAKSPYCNDSKNEGNDEYKFTKIVNHAADNNSNPLNMSVNKHGAPIKNINWSLKKSKTTKGNVDDAQNLLGLIDGAQNSICKSIKHENYVANNIKSSQSMGQENRVNDILRNFPRVEFKKLCDIEEKIVTQQNNVNIKAEKASKSEINMTEAEVKVEQTSIVVSENEQLVKENIATKILQVKPQCDEELVLTAKSSQYKNCQTNCELNSSGSGKRKTRGASNQQSFPAVISDCNERISDAETTQGVVDKSKGIIKYNSSKMMINCIDEPLNKPDERLTVDAGVNLIPKKDAKNLQAIGNESNCSCNDKLALEDFQQSQQSGRIKFCKKTICWREPIEESLDIVPCKSIRNRVHGTNYGENVPTGRPIQSNKGTVHCFRMMAGADFDIDDNMNPSNLFQRMDTGLKNKATIISPNCKEHLVIALNKEQQHNDENNRQTVADILNNKESRTNSEEYVLDEVRSVETSELAKHEMVELVPRNDIKGKESPIMIDKLCQGEELMDLDSKNIEVDEQMITMESNLNTESCKSLMDNLECSNPCSTLQDTTEIENSVTMKISVKTSEGTENEIIDKVVNKITYVLRKTLNKNGYAIEKKHFFKQKNLITNDNGEINRKLIGNEAVWKTELKDIVSHLMKHKNLGNSITFKVKTMILPVTNQKNVTEEGVTNLTSSPNIRQKLVRTVEPDEIETKTGDKQLKDVDSDILIHESSRDLLFKKQFLKNQIRRSSRKKNHIISSCTLQNETHTVDKMLMNDASRTVVSCKDDPHALWKLLKYLVKFRNKFQSIPKKHEKLLRNELRRNKYATINNAAFQQNHDGNDFVTASSRDKLPSQLNTDIDVYLCTEISQEDQSPMTKKIGCDKYSKSNVLNDVSKNSFSTGITIQKNSEMKSRKNNCIQKSEIKSDQDVSDWESFSESDEEVSEIVKHYQHQNKLYSKISNRQFNKITSAERCGLDTSREQPGLRAYASCKTATKDTFWDQNRAKQVELLDTIIKPMNQEYLMPLEAKGLKNIPSLRNSCKIIDIFSSNNQNVERTELRSSGKGSTASLCCTEFEEAEKETKDRIEPNLSKSADGQSILKAKIRKTADNHMESCCTGDKTRNLCTPICNVTSRLRLCSIMKSENERSTANRDILSSHICCCDKLDKLRADGVFPKPPIIPSGKNVVIGNGIVRLTTASCQTESSKRDLRILDQSHASNEDCRKNSNSSFQVTGSETCVINSATEDTKMERAVVQRNTQNSVLTSLDIAAFEEESLILEIKMLQPLFSIKLKKGHKEPRKTEAPVEEDGREFLEHKHHDTNTSADRKSVIKTSLKNSVITPQQRSINCINKTTSTNSINCGVEKIMDQEVELLEQKHEEETLSCGTQTSQICEMGSDAKRIIKVFADHNTTSTSVALNEIKTNASTSCKVECDCLGSSQCNLLLEMLRLLQNYQNLYKISTNEVSMKNSQACPDKAIPHQKENSSHELTKSITLKTLISTVETSLPHITDPIIYEKLTDTIKYIRDQEQNRNYSFKEIYPQDQACGTSKKTLEKSEIESKYDIRPQSLLLTSDGSQCQKPCKSQTLVTTNSSRNIEEILQDENTSSEIKGVAHNTQRKMESPTGHTSTKKEVADQISKNERSELQGNSRLMNTTNYSPIEISGDIEGVESACSSYDPSTNKTVNMIPQFENDENYESSKYYCCHRGSTAVDINAFACMVATQLRGLSPEAALRSQQRIQTLISNSRLESEKNKKYR